MKLQLNCDGGARGNPGPSAYGFVIYDVTNPENEAKLKAGLPAEALAKAGIILDKCGNYLGVSTNNQAEYAGLIAGLRWIIDHHQEVELTIYMDALLIVNQIKGEFKVKHKDIIPLYQEAKAILAKIGSYQIKYIPRAQNAIADELVNLTLDSHQ